MKNKIVILFAALLGLSWLAAINSMMSAPKEYKSHIERAEDLELRGIYIDAISEYETLLTSNPEDAAVIIRMAQDYLALGDEKKYVSTLKKAIELQTDGSDQALDMLMNYYINGENEAKATKYVLELSKKAPQNEHVNEWLYKLKGGYKVLFCIYDEMFGMYNDNMVVRTGDAYSIIDASGNRQLELKYSQLEPFSKDGYAKTVDEQGRTVYIDRDGYTKIAPVGNYSELGMLINSRIVANSNGKYGYLDEEGNPVTDFAWDGLTSYNKVGLAQKGGKWALIGSKGKEKTEYIYDGVATDEYGVACNQERIFVKYGDKYRLIDTKGKEVSESQYDDAKAFSEEGYAAVCKDGKWGFIDADDNLVIKYQYDEALSFHNGYAAVRMGELWGYVDSDGYMLISPSFKEATSFSSEGTAAVYVYDEDREIDRWNIIKLNINR